MGKIVVIGVGKNIVGSSKLKFFWGQCDDLSCWSHKGAFNFPDCLFIKILGTL